MANNCVKRIRVLGGNYWSLMAGYDTNKSRERNRRMRKRESSAKPLSFMSTACMHKTVLTEVWHHQRSYAVKGIDLTNIVP